MVQVIERRDLAGKDRCVEIHVYRLPQDASVVVAKTIYGEPLGYGHRWHMSRLDIPVAEAYLDAVRLAEKQTIPFVWVNDPHKLFPPSKRPSLDLVEAPTRSEPEPPSPAGGPEKRPGRLSLRSDKPDETSGSA